MLSCSHSPAGRDGGSGERNQSICGAEPLCDQTGSEFRAKASAELLTTFCIVWPRVLKQRPR